MDWSGQWRSAVEMLWLLSQQTFAVPAWLLLAQCLAPCLLFAALRYPHAFGLFLILAIGFAGLASDLFRAADPIVIIMTMATTLSFLAIHQILQRAKLRANGDVLHAIELVADRIDTFLDAVDERTLQQNSESAARAERDQDRIVSDTFRPTRSASG